MINKLRAKINGKEEYNVRNPLGMGDQKIDRGKTVAICIILESFCNQALEDQEEELVLGSSSSIKFHTPSPRVCYSIYLQSCLVLEPILYKFIVLG